MFEIKRLIVVIFNNRMTPYVSISMYRIEKGGDSTNRNLSSVTRTQTNQFGKAEL